MGDLGGYGIAELPPAGPLFARGPYRALGQKGNPWEVVRNSISAHVTHAEITHFISNAMSKYINATMRQNMYENDIQIKIQFFPKKLLSNMSRHRPNREGSTN